jgi:hypothetical protein
MLTYDLSTSVHQVHYKYNKNSFCNGETDDKYGDGDGDDDTDDDNNENKYAVHFVCC